MKPFLISKFPMALTILAMVAWTWTISALFFGDSPRPAQAATVSLSAQDSLQVFLVIGSERVLLEGDAQLIIGRNAVGYLDKVSPLPLEVEVHNITTDWLAMRVSGDQSTGIVPIFGDVPIPGSDASVDLAPRGATGSGVMGLLDFQLQKTDSLRRGTSIRFTTLQADASQQPSLPTSLGFEDDSLGNLCSFLDSNRDPIVDPVRDEFLESHGVSFSSGHADDGLAILHECGNFGLDSRGDGDYLLVGNERAELATEGIPELPLIATFSQPVTQVSLWAATGVRGGSDTLSLKLTAYADAGASGEVVATSSLDASMEWQQLSVQAEDSEPFRSVKLTNESDVHSYLVDEMEWTWVQEKEEEEEEREEREEEEEEREGREEEEEEREEREEEEEERAVPPSCLGVSRSLSP